MAKLQIKSETTATFGGIFHIMDVFERLGLGRLVDSCLGSKSQKVKITHNPKFKM